MGSEIGDNIHPHSQGYFVDETCSAAADVAAPQSGIMQKFCLYETHSNFYMVGRNKSRTYWRVLKIDRLDSSELNVLEDPTIYTRRECSDLLRRIDEGNRSTGGLKFVSKCYGIVGFIKFLGPYYMLLITERKAIGAICGHTIYAVSKSEILPLPNPAVLEDVATSKNENRYKKILCNVDLTKDFFFSYSYHVMCNFQKNMCDNVEEKAIYETSFVWNEFLTRGIRNLLKNTLWTVALVYGFYKQSADDKCLTLLPLPVLYNTEVPSFVEYQATQSFAGRDIKLILIARRSRHYAGTRYLKRGVNEHGRVANDVETEQILFEDASEGFPLRISSVVQNRGSIPLFWSQDTSRLNLKPDIILSKRDQTYQATRLHFDDLVRRYGNPIIILNLIKTHEKRPRESILRTEFANAIEVINKDLSEDNNLKFIHWDLNKHSKSQATDVLQSLGKVASYALALTGFFYCQVTPGLISEGSVNWSHFKNFVSFNKSLPRHQDINKERHSDNADKDAKDVETILIEDNNVADEVCCVKPPMFQKGVLRTNCIDCLDRTNVAQYAYGLIALGQQLNALGVKDSPKIDLDDPLADYLMTIYERMGDTLAHQYGGSAAHNKIFSQRRGQWKAATQSQEFFRTLQRYYSNAYMDAEKQSAINLFLGNFQPQHGKPQVWELNYNQHYDVYQNAQQTIDEDRRSFIKRSISDGSILRGSRPPGSVSNEDLTKAEESRQGRSESTPDVTDMIFSRYTPQPHSKEHCGDMQKSRSMAYDNRDASDYSNFIDLDWLSSSSSCEEELDRSTVMNSSAATLSTESLGKELVGETIPSTSAYGSSMKRREITGTELSCDEGQNHEAPDEFSDSFVRWVTQGETLCF